jgi:peroxiredoxin
MAANFGSDTLDEKFKFVRDLEAFLQGQLRTFVEASRRECPEFSAAVDRLVTRLRQYGAGQAAPRVGDSMPPFVLPDESGKLVSLDALRDRGPAAVTFHRGHWCPYSRININGLAAARNVLPAGAEIVAIMPDWPKSAPQTKPRSLMPFPILTDVDNGYAMSLNLTIWVGGELQKMMEERQLHLATFQSNRSWMLPISATFVIGRDAVIKARFIDPDHRNGMMISEMVAAMI